MSQCHSPEFFASWFQRNYIYYESMGANDLGYDGQFGPKGQGLHRGPLNIATY